MAKNNSHEDAELEKSYQSVAGKYAKKKTQKSNVGVYIGIGVAGVVLLAAVIGIISMLSSPSTSMESPGATIAATTAPEKLYATIFDMDISGLTKAEVIEKIDQRFSNAYKTSTMVVKVGEDVLELTPDKTKAGFDTEAYVDALFASESPEAVPMSDYLILDSNYISGALQTIADDNASTMEDGNITTVGTLPDLSEKSENGAKLTLVVTMGTPGVDLSRDSIFEKVMQAYSKLQFEVVIPTDVQEPAKPDVAKAIEEYCKEPENATLDRDTKEVVGHRYGYAFDEEAVLSFIETAGYGESKEFPFSYSDPKILTGQFKELLFRDELATYTAHGGSVSGRDVNLRKACEALNDVILLPGEIFDYNTTLGERTAEGGWKAAGAYVGGQTVQQIGGGICQPSSCLYYCALMADLEIVLRYNHQYISSYMPPGMDATVSWGGPDFRFKNNTDYPIKIKASASGGSTTLSIVGTDTKDYYVKMEYETVATHYWKTIEKEYSANSGYSNGHVITSPYTGYTIQTYKCKYDKATDALLSRVEWTLDVYDHRDKVVVKIPGSTTPTEPSTEPTTPSTEPTTPPVTDPPVTEPPVTDPPVTEPPVTEPPATEPPVTEPPAVTSPPVDEGSGSENIE